MSLFELWFLFIVLPFIDKVGIFSTIVLGVIAVISTLILITTSVEDPEFRDNFITGVKNHKVIFFVLMSVSFMGGVVPDKGQVALIVGGSVVTNVEGINELPENVIKAANNYLKTIEPKE